MTIIQTILNWARARGYAARYGSVYQINDYLTGVDYSQSLDGIAVYMYLITAMESRAGHARAEVGVLFSSLCDFDFDGEALLVEQQRLMDASKGLLYCIDAGNELRTVGEPRWQFGYDDFAENVCWCCLRVTLEDMAGDCVPLGEGCE